MRADTSLASIRGCPSRPLNGQRLWARRPSCSSWSGVPIPTTARRLAAHYESDRAVLRKNTADGSLRLEWQTRWDDSQAAELAERTFLLLDRCAAMQDKDPDVPLGKEIHVRREHRHVVLVRGVSAADATPILLDLLIRAPSKALTLGPVPGKIPDIQTVVPGIQLARRWSRR